MAVSLPGAYRMTFDDWLETPDDGYRYELFDGELVVSPPPSIRHQRISMEVAFRLRLWSERAGGAFVLAAPVGVRFGDGIVFEPDIVVVLREHAERVGEAAIDAPPDLVVEILSPGTAVRDLGVKRERYQASGVPEYWIVDPRSETIEVLSLRAGELVRAGLYGRGGRLVSPLLSDLDFAVADIFD